MPYFIAFCYAAAACLFASSACAAPWETWNDPRTLALVGGEGTSLLASSYCLDGCRYDRSSDDPGLGKRRFVRLEQTPQGEQGVIFEHPGAGAITRIWMTTGDGVSQPLDPNVRIRVYLDGAAAPAIDLPLPQFFDGAAPFTEPLARDRDKASGGNVSYVPIAYRDGIKVALLHGADKRLWFQLNYATTPDVAAVTSYTPSMRFPALKTYLEGAGNDTLFATVPSAPGNSAQLVAGAPPVTVVAHTGTGWLRRASIAIAPQYWKSVEIAWTIDGETVAQLPIERFFFAHADDQVRQSGAFFGVDRTGAFYSRLPLPFRDSIAVTLRVRDGVHSASPIPVRYASEFDATPPPPNAGRFRVHTVDTCPTTPLVDDVLLDVGGAGRIVGLASAMTTTPTSGGGYYLEGDERLYIDGSMQPLWYGTGVEDMYNGGFYFDHGAYTHPLASAPLRVPAGVGDRTRMVRWFLSDGPSWRNALRFALENGAWGTEPLCQSVNVYYFQTPQSTQIPVATLVIGDAASVQAANYLPAADAQCGAQSGTFGDEPPTAATYRVCAGAQASRFILRTPEAGTAFRLRRTYDAALASVGGQAAQVWINGVRAGAFGPIQANTARRWTQQDVDVRLAAPATQLDIEIRPQGGPASEAMYTLFATPGDAIFADGFD